MRALVTGASGFVGKYLLAALADADYDAIPVSGPGDDRFSLQIDITDFDSVRQVLAETKPDVVFHLAGQAFVPASIANPLETFRINALGTMHMLEAIRLSRGSARGPRLLLAGSASVYGRVADWHNPLKEDYPIRPIDPYGASKAAAECACIAAWHSHGIEAVIARSFNHIGPGQDQRFVTASFASQLARIKLGLDEPILHVGNIVTERDFLNVRDVVTAYIMLAQSGQPGEIYNVCSGAPVRIQDILRSFIYMANVPVEIREDPAKMRDADVRQFYGDNSRLRSLGWLQTISLEASLGEIFKEALEHAAMA